MPPTVVPDFVELEPSSKPSAANDVTGVVVAPLEDDLLMASVEDDLSPTPLPTPPENVPDDVADASEAKATYANEVQGPTTTLLSEEFPDLTPPIVPDPLRQCILKDVLRDDYYACPMRGARCSLKITGDCTKLLTIG